MNKIYSIFLVAIATLSFLSCGSEEDAKPKRQGQLNPNALVTISPAAGVQIRAVGDADSDTAFTALEVMLRAHGVHYHTKYSGHSIVDVGEEIYTGTGFAPEQKDTANAKLKFWGTAIIESGRLQKDLLYARDLVITGGDPSKGEAIYWNSNDTLAYIPNAVVQAARAKIEKAFADSNYTEVYRLFDEAFTYIPCTAKQYKELKAKGLN